MEAIRIISPASPSTRPVPLAPPRRPSDEDDLHWYFTRAPAPSSLRSSYPALIRRLLTDGPIDGPVAEEPFEISVLDDAERARRIERILAATDKEAVRRLAACLGASEPRHVNKLGRVAGIAMETEVFRRAHRDDGTVRDPLSWLSDLALFSCWDRKAKTLVAAIRLEAEQRYREAVLAYREGKRKAGCTGRAEQGGSHV